MITHSHPSLFFCNLDSPTSTTTTATATYRPTSTTTNSFKTTTTTTISATTTATTTTTTDTIPIIATCPNLLVSPYTTQLLLTLDATDAFTSFQKFSSSLTTPAGVSEAMIVFQFITGWGSWYLDDVSIRSTNGLGTNLLSNGDFESGSLGDQWKYCDTRYFWLTEGTVISHTHNFGSYSYESKDPGAGSDEYLTQTFNIESGKEYNIEFYLAILGQPKTANVTLLYR